MMTGEWQFDGIWGIGVGRERMKTGYTFQFTGNIRTLLSGMSWREAGRKLNFL